MHGDWNKWSVARFGCVCMPMECAVSSTAASFSSRTLQHDQDLNLA